MKSLITFIIMITLGCLVGYYLHQGPGQVIIAYQNWLIQMPIWLAAIITILIAFLCFLMIKLFAFLTHSKTLFTKWQQRRQEEKARIHMTEGLIELTEGHWAKAEKLLTQTILPDASLINYLFAARAAQAQEAYDRRDDYLRLAHQNNTKADIAVSLTQAELQINHEQYEQALATLVHIINIHPKHKTALMLLKDLYIKLDDWNNLLKLLPNLLRYKVIEKESLQTLEVKCYESLLTSAAKNTNNIKQITELWRQAPDHILTNHQLTKLYIQLLIASEQYKEAEIRIKQSLKQQWNPELVKLYGQLKLPENAKLLTTAEQWLEAHPSDAHLLLALGKICTHQKLWGKAKDYLSASLKFMPMQETYKAMATLLEETGEHHDAARFYRDGFLLTSH